MNIDLYENESGEFRWTAKADNGEIVASGEGYVSASNLRRGIQTLISGIRRGDLTVTDRTTADGAPVELHLDGEPDEEQRDLDATERARRIALDPSQGWKEGK